MSHHRYHHSYHHTYLDHHSPLIATIHQPPFATIHHTTNLFLNRSLPSPPFTTAVVPPRPYAPPTHLPTRARTHSTQAYWLINSVKVFSK